MIATFPPGDGEVAAPGDGEVAAPVRSG